MKNNEIVISCPIGIIPEYLFNEQRLRELGSAIIRYAEVSFKIDPEWVTEYNTRVQRVIDRQK